MAKERSVAAGTAFARWTMRERSELSMRLLRGEAIESLVGETGVPAEILLEWRRHFMGDRSNRRYLTKRLVSRFPTLQQDLKRTLFRWQIWRRSFLSDEPEFAFAGSVVREGDWVLDIGANIGHYTLRFSSLVGPTGRVFAFEPIPESFELLSSNSTLAPHQNITLCNMAVSDSWQVVDMGVPFIRPGLRSYSNACIRTEGSGTLTTPVLTCTIDGFDFVKRISLVKIDVEGHEAAVLRGMRHLIERDSPNIFIEISTNEAEDLLAALGYQACQLPDSACGVVYRRVCAGQSDGPVIERDNSQYIDPKNPPF